MATRDPSLTNPLLTFTMTNGALQLCDNVTANTDFATRPGFYFNCPDGMEFTWPAQLTVTNKDASSIYIIAKTESSDGRPYYKYKRPSGGAPSIPNTDDGSQWSFDSDFIASLCEAASAATPAPPATPTTGLRGAYVGVGGLAKPITKIYVGVGGAAKEVKLAYVGVPIEDPPAKIVNNTPATLTLYVGGTPFPNGAIPPGGQLELETGSLDQGATLISDYPGLILDSVPEGWTQTVGAANTQFQKTGEGSSEVTFVSNDVRLLVDNSSSVAFIPTRYSTKSSGYTGPAGDFSDYNDAPTVWRGTGSASTSFYCYVAVEDGFSLDGPSSSTAAAGTEDVTIHAMVGGAGYCYLVLGPNPSVRIVDNQ